MTGSVLAAVDLVHPGHRAAILKRAETIAGLDGLGLAVVTVIPDFGMSIVGSYFDADVEKTLLDRAAKDLHAAVTRVLGAERDPRIQHIVRHGKAYEEILRTAEEQSAALIVMGAHRPNFRDYLLGPNAASVVRHSPCSVFILRE